MLAASDHQVRLAPDQRRPPFGGEVAELARPQPAFDGHRRRIRWPAQIARHDIAAADDDFADAVRRTEAPVVARDGDLDPRHGAPDAAGSPRPVERVERRADRRFGQPIRSEEHTSELQSLMRISYAVFCLKKTKKKTRNKDE